VALALVPAACEEALFRGALLRALAPRFGGPAAVALAALAFGCFHFSLYKLVPTTALALVLGALALASGSLWPAVLAHATNNALVVCLGRAGWLDPPGAGQPLPLAAAALGLVAGLALVRRRRVRR
jgi:membrane protease YdiL (CAAX protease family)